MPSALPCLSPCVPVHCRSPAGHTNATKQAQSYDPRRSNVKEEALAEFIRAPITGDLTEVRALHCTALLGGPHPVVLLAC